MALKRPLAAFVEEKEFVARFVREAEIGAKLDHPNIVRGISVGEEKGFHYFAMEFVDGATCEKLLAEQGKLKVGDAVMAIFNAPVQQEDHTMRAVRAALNMRYDIMALHEVMEPQYRLSFGIAINVGEAVVGLVGTKMRLDYTAIGDTINTAKRIQENAKAGQVLLSEAVYQQVKNVVVVNALEPMKVKGRVQPVQVYELLDLK